MAKVKLTKNEFKKQKDALKRFQRFLPMLILKKQQLQAEINNVYAAQDELRAKMENARVAVMPWVDVFADATLLSGAITIRKIKTHTGNIAGIDIPIFSGVDYDVKEYDKRSTPFWVDKGIEAVKAMVDLRARLDILRRQAEILHQELLVVSQRVNLFEKVKIPESKEAIRTIQIYLGDMQTAAVVRGKIAKVKIEKRKAQ